MTDTLNSLEYMKRLAVPGAKFLRRFPNTTIPASTRIVAYKTEAAEREAQGKLLVEYFG